VSHSGLQAELGGEVLRVRFVLEATSGHLNAAGGTDAGAAFLVYGGH